MRIVRRRIMAEMRTIRIMVTQDVQQRFGERLREVRKRAGFTKEGLAEAAGLDRSYCGSVERGERNVALRNIEALADALGITISELMEGV